MAATQKGFAGLTSKQQERHRNLLASLGIDVEETLDRHISTAGAKAPVMISTDLHTTVIIPKMMVAHDVAMMKQFGGIPDERYTSGEMKDDFVTYPPAWDSRFNRLIDKAESHRQLVQSLSSEQRANVRQALSSYLLGNSQRVSSYETIINEVHFPQYAAIFAADTLCVPAGTTVIVGPNQDLRALNPEGTQDPYVVTFSSVCIETGGQIQYQVPTNMTVSGSITMMAPGGCNC